jgi:hypothetical protein
MQRRRADRVASIVFVCLCAAAVAMCAIFLWPMIGGAFTSADDIHVADPARAVRDARTLIGDGKAVVRAPESLPASLRIPGLRFALVHQDHVDLVLARNPDWMIGARIWSEHHRPHRDEPTKYRDIYFYRYNNDYDLSEDNIL